MSYYSNFPSLLIGTGAKYDADALAFFSSAANVTDPTDMALINAFILDCKDNGNWNQLAVYIYYGTTATTQAVNLKNPSLYSLSFTGITHSAAGIQGDGSTNVVDTGIQVSTSGLTTSNVHLAFYTPTTTFSATTVADIGAFNGSNLLELGVYGGSPNAKPNAALIANATVAGNNSGSTNGFWYAEPGGGGNTNFQKNGVSAGSVSSTAATISNITGTLKLTARTNNAGTVSRRSAKTQGFASVGPKVGDSAAYAAAVLTLMAGLGR